MYIKKCFQSACLNARKKVSNQSFTWHFYEIPDKKMPLFGMLMVTKNDLLLVEALDAHNYYDKNHLDLLITDKLKKSLVEYLKGGDYKGSDIKIPSDVVSSKRDYLFELCRQVGNVPLYETPRIVLTQEMKSIEKDIIIRVKHLAVRKP